jgi:hypothetical protein
VPDEAAMRRSIEDTLVRVVAGGEADLAAELVHPEFVNHEATQPDHRLGPEGLIATSEWLRSSFGAIS